MPSDFKEKAEISRATFTSSHSVFRKLPPRAASGANAIECNTPSKYGTCSETAPARFARSSLLVTSS